MSYLFPKRVLRAGDILNPVELTEDIAPAADAVSGRLNAHNISSTIDLSIAVDPEAYYAVTHKSVNAEIYWAGDGGLAPGNYDVPDEGTISGDEVLVQNNFEWQSLVSVDGDSMIASISTGTSVLWVNAYVQYIWWGFNYELIDEPFTDGTRVEQHFNGAQKYPANMQFAIRVDGTILPETITGVDDISYRASMPLKPTSQMVDSIFPGPADPLGKQLTGLGPPVLPVRLGACYPVQPGDHVVEIVCRRVPYVGGSDLQQYGPMDKIYLYSRQIHVADLKMFPIDSVGAAETTADAFDAETPVSQASMYTNRVQRVVSAYNAVQEGSLQRGALMHLQLPQALLNADSTERSYGSGRKHNNWFPGHNDDTVTTTVYSGSPGLGWAEISDLEVMDFVVDQPMRVLVLANLQVKNIFGNVYYAEGKGSDTSSDTYPLGEYGRFFDFALFKIMWQPNTNSLTDWTGVQESLGLVNNFVWWPRKMSADPDEAGTSPANLVFGLENVEIQLMAELTFNEAQPDPINIGLFGSVASENTEFLYTRGSIQAIGMRY